MQATVEAQRKWIYLMYFECFQWKGYLWVTLIKSHNYESTQIAWSISKEQQKF